MSDNIAHTSMAWQAPIQMAKDACILITGGTGLLGSALHGVLHNKGYTHIVALGSKDGDLRVSSDVAAIFTRHNPQFVFHLAAKAYGLGGNLKYKSDILYQNVLMNLHVVEEARKAGVQKILGMGSGCVYPELKGVEELCEHQMFLGAPHGSEETYAHSKRLMYAHLKAANEQYGLRSIFTICGNLYGPKDNFNPLESRVIPSLVYKFYEAKRNKTPVTIWGTGAAMRDFSYAEDAAEALYTVMCSLEGAVNIASGFKHKIRDIVDILDAVTDKTVEIQWDRTQPDGQLQRYYNLDVLNATGYTAKVPLAQGIARTYKWYCEHAKT